MRSISGAMGEMKEPTSVRNERTEHDRDPNLFEHVTKPVQPARCQLD